MAYSHTKAWRERNPDKYKAHNTLGKAVSRGKIQRQPCIECGEEDTQAHHHDYTKPLDVQWLCTACHSKRHPKAKGDNTPSPELRNAARALRVCGLSFGQIGRILGRQRGTVQRWVEDIRPGPAR